MISMIPANLQFDMVLTCIISLAFMHVLFPATRKTARISVTLQ